ncbi:sensor histidine kinase [Aquincola sp. MAHUQ-54]|uniref:histidine kinase n=1 Tax=Aquincola agrisoli TaxID=3119538 RepID=A0AAW9QFL6_9BURK
MNIDALHRMSLRRTLIIVLLAGVLAASVIQVVMTWRTAQAAVNAAFDRSLYGAIRSIAANVSTESGGLGVELPYLLFEFFELTASGPVYYRIATEDGLVEIGHPDLPMPRERLEDRQPHFATVDYAGSPVRVGTYVSTLDRPVGGSSDRRLVIQVAEELASRSQFSQQLIVNAVARDILLAAVVAGMVAAAVSWSLRPLQQLRHEVRSRASDDLSPVDLHRVPADVLPLVEAMNQHVFRYRELLATQRRFLDDASHQLRTPLSTLLTQVTYAQREPDIATVRDTLRAMRQQLKHTIRQANQMLALARADALELACETTDVSALAGGVAKRWWPAARDKGVDLGFEAAAVPLRTPVQRELVEEALSNLIDNALRHTPAGGRITVRAEARPDRACLHVGDNGPGIPEAELAQATQRFFRASNSQGAGSGLGLAIVASIAKRHRGALILAREPNEGGLLATLELPLPAGAGGHQPPAS